MPVTDYPDGIGRVEALRRLLALEQEPRPLFTLRWWLARLAALWFVWRAR